MDVEVSRRVGRVMWTTKVFTGLSETDRARVIKAVETADSYQTLPQWIKDLVVKAEKEWK